MNITPNTVVSFDYSLYEGEEDQPRTEVDNSHK